MYRSNKSSSIGNRSGSNRHSHNSDRVNNRFSIGTYLIDEEEYKEDYNQIFNDDSKFARQLKKLLRDEEEERRVQKVLDLSAYLDQPENIKFVLKLSGPALNILLKVLWEQKLNETRVSLIDCIGKIGNIVILNDRDPNRYFDWVVDKLGVLLGDQKENLKDNKLKSILAQQLLKDFKSPDISPYVQDNVEYILGTLKKILECVDVPNVMIDITRIITLSASYVPDAAAMIFQDLVDILIAWHIDSSQPEYVIDFISSTLVELRQYWLKDLDFTITLLFQFLEDVESYVGQEAVLSGKRKKDFETIEKMSALFDVFNTVIKSICCLHDPSYPPLKQNLSSNAIKKMIEALRRLLVCVCNMSESNYIENLYEPTNECLNLYFDTFDDSIFTIDNNIVDFILKQTTSTYEQSMNVDMSFVKFLLKTVNHYLASNNVEFFKELISYDARLWNYRFSMNPELIQKTLLIYKSLIVTKSIPIVQEVYKSILNDSEISFAVIARNSEPATSDNDARRDADSPGIKILNRNPAHFGIGMLQELKFAETSFIFNLCILAELGNSKNNLISMYALSPTLFELFTGKLSPCNWSLAEKFPNIQFAILNLLYSHCTRHDNFIASSQLFASRLNSETPLISNAVTRTYFKTILEVIIQIIPHPSSSVDTSALVLNWTNEIVTALAVEHSYLFDSALFTNLFNSIITAAYSSEKKICLLCQQILCKTQRKFGAFCLNESIQIRMLDLCKYYVTYANTELRSSYVELISCIPLNILLRHVIDTNSLTINDFTILASIARSNYLSSSNESVLSVQNFKAIVGFLLVGIDAREHNLANDQWLERMFYSSQRNVVVAEKPHREHKSDLDSITLETLIENQQCLQWFWALWECSQFCVQAKLKTPLGKAQDTFVAIENTIKDYHMNNSANTRINLAEGTSKLEECILDLSRVTGIVNFVEYLEKSIYNAYEGTAVSLIPATKLVKIFFRTNKSTCNEWFWRVRSSVISIAVRSGNYEIVVRQAYEYINYFAQHNYPTPNSDLDQVVVNLVKALVKLRAWQSLVGLRKWLNQTFKKLNFDWISASVDEARGRLEMASESYKSFFKNAITNAVQAEKQTINPANLPINIAKYHSEKTFDCYFELHDWENFVEWHNEYKETISDRFEAENHKQMFETKYDINYIKALSSFETLDFEKSLGYAQNTSWFNDSGQQADDLIAGNNYLWDVNEIESAFLKEIFRTVINKRRINVTSTSLVEELARVYSESFNPDEVSLFFKEKLAYIHLASLSTQTHLEHLKSDPVFSRCMKLNPGLYNFKAINNYELLLKNNRQMLNDRRYNQFLNEFKLQTVRLARKQKNFGLSIRLLNDYMQDFLDETNDQLGLTSMTSGAKSNKPSRSVYESLTAIKKDFYQAIESELSNSSKQFGAKEQTKLNFEMIKLEKESFKLLNESKSVDSNFYLQSLDILSTSVHESAGFFFNNLAMFKPANSTVASHHSEQFAEACARSMLRLYKFLQADSSVLSKKAELAQTSSDEPILDSIRSSLEKIVGLTKQVGNYGELSFFKTNSGDANSSSSSEPRLRERVIGELLDMATVVSPKLTKAWFTMANWCFEQGRKTKSDSDLELDDDYVKLIDERIAPANLSPDDSQFIHSLFDKCLDSIRITSLQNKSARFNIKQQQKLQHQISEDHTEEMVSLSRDKIVAEMRIQLLKNCSDLGADSVEGLLNIWKSVANRIYYYNKLACKSYFAYLKLSSNDKDDKSFESGNVSATLRILKLLVKYAAELKDDLQTGLAQTPTHPWKDIIPQLFCRLNHQEIYVRLSVSELLCAIARDFPHLIIFPAVVGSQDGPIKLETMHSTNEKILFDNENLDQSNADNAGSKQQQSGSQSKSAQSPQQASAVNEEEADENDEPSDDDIENLMEEQDDNQVVIKNEMDEETGVELDGEDAGASNEEDDEDQEIVNQEKQVELKNAYKYLLDTLSASNPKMIDEVKLFVHEMRRITLLREELWLGTLNQIHADVLKRIEQLNMEINKVASNPYLTDSGERASIIKEKYDILLKPIVSILEHVHDITSKLAAQTPNEEAFHQEFSSQIENAINHLKNKNQNAFRPASGWGPFKQLHGVLHQRSQRRQSSTLVLDQISPKLANLKASSIPLPGKDGQFCTIQAIGSSVLILPTKTKPKKLFFIGSNGKRYPYLFKGLEDLHLDERIMQLLSIVNTMFYKTNRFEHPSYHALHYTVTPLGPRSGLISWVEGTTPLFSLYKKWQHREANYLSAKQKQQQQQQQPQQPQQQQQQQQAPILRPQDVFFSKLNPLLKEKGIKNFNQNRDDCPKNLLRQVLEELMKETPSDLLAKELWCHATTPGVWWNNVQVYSRCTAVMSIIGYVIGLGDRHLDNVLIDFSNGQVAHIDYNICFEKGLNLRVPERVPFRMTPNLRTALGLTGVEGLFRLSCEHVMETLKRGKETLLILLEAFVYDPLLDWTGNDTGIIASFYGGGGGQLASSVAESSSASQALPVEGSNNVVNSIEALKSKNTKESRKNMEKSMTNRLYEIRLIETRHIAKKNCESLVELLTNLESLLQMLNSLGENKKANFVALTDEIVKSVPELKAVFNQHNLMMSDIKPLLKAMSRHGDNHKLQAFTVIYSQFSENCQRLLCYLTNNDFLQTKSVEIQQTVTNLKSLTPKVYDELRHLNRESDTSFTAEASIEKPGAPLVAPNESGASSERDVVKKMPATRMNSKIARSNQECNSYAIGVWKRVFQKLDGRDPYPDRQIDTQEQVDYVIRQATDLNNLASLYEGWTPWV